MAEEDPLSWLLELDAKLDGAKEMLGVLEQNQDQLKALDAALKKAESSTKGLSDGQKKHSHEVKTTAGEVKELKERLNDITAFAIGEWGLEKAGELLEKAIDLTGELVKETVTTAAAAERTATSFKLMFGAQEGSEILEYIEQLAHHTEFSQVEMKGFAQELRKAGFEAKDLPHALAATADMAAFSKNRIEGATGALQALERIQRTGKVMERTLAPLGLGENALIEVLKKRGNVKGEHDEIVKKLAKGEIDKAEVLNAVYQTITEKTGKALGGAAVEVGKGLEARLNRIKNLPEEYFEKWSNTPGFQAFSDRIDDLFKKLDPSGPEGAKIFAELEKVMGEVINVLDDLLTPEGIEAFTTGLKTALGVAADLISAMKTLIDLASGETISKLMFAGDEHEQKLRNIEFKKQELKAGSFTPGERAEREKELEGMISGLGTADLADYRHRTGGDKVKQPEGKLPGDDLAGDLAIVPSIEDLNKTQQSGVLLGDALEQGTRDALDVHSPSRVMAEIGRYSAIGFAEGVSSGSDRVAGAFEDMSSLPAPSLQVAGGASGGGSGSFEFHFSMPITIEGGSGDDAKATAERIQEIVPSALQSALEQFRAEMGV